MSSWTDDDGMRVWLAKLDPITATEISSSLNAEYDRLWRLDGGRDGNHRDSPDRSPQQRMADAFVSLITGVKGESVSGNSHLRHHMMSIVDLSRMRVDDPQGSAAAVVKPPPVNGRPWLPAIVDVLTVELIPQYSRPRDATHPRPQWLGHNQ